MLYSIFSQAYFSQKPYEGQARSNARLQFGDGQDRVGGGGLPGAILFRAAAASPAPAARCVKSWLKTAAERCVLVSGGPAPALNRVWRSGSMASQDKQQEQQVLMEDCSDDEEAYYNNNNVCLLYTSPSPRDS